MTETLTRILTPEGVTCLVLDEDGDEESDAGDDVEREDRPPSPDSAEQNKKGLSA